MTRDEVRQLILENMKLGLVRFWIAKGTTTEVTVSVPIPENEEEKIEDKDPWNFWVFRLGADGFFDGQESSTSSNLNFNISTKRVTDKNKFSFRVSFGENKSTYASLMMERIS